MTVELARSARMLPVVPRQRDTLLARRLDRLRQQGFPPAAGPGPAGGGAALVDTPAAGLARAGRLAAAVGGHVVHMPEGPVAVVESRADVDFERDALAALPFGFDGLAPLVCVDVETTGLGTAAGTLPFLVGIGTVLDGGLHISQLLLPDHALEPALLSAIAARVPAGAWLVTYNGRSFDWPLIVSRFRLHRRHPPDAAGHLDLLPVARQLWKHRLGSARLASVERVAGVRRGDDLPGALVPERYFRYLRSGDAAALRPVMRHNRQDVISLALLLRLLVNRVGRRERWPALHPGDLHGLARAYSRQGRLDEALECLDAALVSTAHPIGTFGADAMLRVLTERARLLARAGRYDEAAESWLRLTTTGGARAAAAWLWLARHREHRLRDAAAALEACLAAAGVAERSRAWGRPLPGVEADLRRRLPRLRRRAVSPARAPSDRPRRAA